MFLVTKTEDGGVFSSEHCALFKYFARIGQTLGAGLAAMIDNHQVQSETKKEGWLVSMSIFVILLISW